MPHAPLHVGDPAPEFALPSDSGAVVRLSDLRGRRVVLFFYPKDDTPGCTRQACGFRDHYPDLSDRNTVVLGISPDSVASHRRFKAKYGLPFPLLADKDHAVAEAYGAWGEKSMYGKSYHGILRSHFVIDEGGRLADIRVTIGPEESVTRALAAVAG